MHTPHPGAFDKDQAFSFQQRIYGGCVCVCVCVCDVCVTCVCVTCVCVYFGSFTRLTCVNKWLIAFILCVTNELY